MAGEGRGVILTRCRTVRRLFPKPPLHCTCHSIVHRAPFGVKNSPKPCVTFQLRGKEKGRGNDVVSGSSQTSAPFQFPFIVLHGRGALFNFEPCRILLLQPSSPTPSHIANFSPRRRHSVAAHQESPHLHLGCGM
jgi:hypothetical protein